MTVRFIILTAGRSGSSFLCGALQTHPDILCFGELLEASDAFQLRDKDIRLRKKTPRETVRAYCDGTVFTSVNRGYAAVGFKVKYYHFENPDLARYIRRTQMSIVHLRRRNLIAQSLSLPLAERHAFSDYLGDRRHRGRYSYPARVDVDDVIDRAEENEREGARLDERFRSQRLIHVYYHEVCRSDAKGTLTSQAEVDRILRFLGVESRVLRSEFAKQRRRPYAELIENYAVLRKVALQRHPGWERHFREMESGDPSV